VDSWNANPMCASFWFDADESYSATKPTISALKNVISKDNKNSKITTALKGGNTTMKNKLKSSSPVGASPSDSTDGDTDSNNDCGYDMYITLSVIGGAFVGAIAMYIFGPKNNLEYERLSDGSGRNLL